MASTNLTSLNHYFDVAKVIADDINYDEISNQLMASYHNYNGGT